MPALPVDHDLGARLFRIHLLDAPLQLEHHGAGGVDDFDAPLLGQRVGCGRFAVCAQQHLRAPGQRLEFGVPDGLQSQCPQPFALAPVVYDVAQAAERVGSPQFFLGLADGRRHPEAEARRVVDFDVNHCSIYYIRSTSVSRTPFVFLKNAPAHAGSPMSGGQIPGNCF